MCISTSSDIISRNFFSLLFPCTSIYICLPLLPCYVRFFLHQTTVYMSSFCSLECRFLFVDPSQIFSNGKKRFPPADHYNFFIISSFWHSSFRSLLLPSSFI